MSQTVQIALQRLYDHHHGVTQLTPSAIELYKSRIDLNRIESFSALPLDRRLQDPALFTNTITSDAIKVNYLMRSQQYCQTTRSSFMQEIREGTWIPQVLEDILIGALKTTGAKLMLGLQTVHDGSSYPLIKGCFYDVSPYNQTKTKERLKLPPQFHQTVSVRPHHQLFRSAEMKEMDTLIDKTLKEFTRSGILPAKRDKDGTIRVKE